MIYVLCPDENTPIGGVKILYRHVDLLRRIGIPATIVHDSEGFRCTWFENTTPVIDRSRLDPGPDAVVVLPEVFGLEAAHRFPGVHKVIFNQSGSLTFRDYPIEGGVMETPYLDPEVLATLVISEHVERYMRYSFPAMPLARVRWSIDPDVFRYARAKKDQICFMPRKHPEEATQVFNILRYRGALDRYSVVPIDNLDERGVARVMSESLFFFSFGYPEGLPLPPAEAMASGCVVVGYHGFGGEEYLKAGISYPIPAGDVLEFAITAERVLGDAVVDRQSALELGERAAAFVAEGYSPEREIDEIRQAWSAIFELKRAGSDRTA